jgi:hypothetical protein
MKYYFSIDKSNKNKTYEKDCYGVVNNNLITDGCKNWQCSHSEYNIMNSEQWKQNTFGCTYIKRFHCCNNREGIVSPWRPKTCPTMTSELSSRGSEKSKKKSPIWFAPAQTWSCSTYFSISLSPLSSRILSTLAFVTWLRSWGAHSRCPVRRHHHRWSLGRYIDIR